MWFGRAIMSNPFNEKTEQKTNQPSNINIQPEVAQPNKAPIIIVEGEASGSVAQMIQEENELVSEKQRLLAIMDELESRLTSEIKSKKSSISVLRAEVSQLQMKCEQLASALDIPVVK
jgi:hypothetical protein